MAPPSSQEEALRKLEKTHNNIDRVNDIIIELENQVGPLKIQSEKAKEYLENKKGLDKAFYLDHRFIITV